MKAETGSGKFVSHVALAVFIVLFLGVKLFVAWLLRNECNGDLAIVQLMVRDIVDGCGLPVFFYGQAYMGAFEPIVNSITYLCCGRTNFGLELGTLLFTCLSIFFALRLSRRIGGVWAAVVTLAFCAVGPISFSHYAVSPRGGYGVLFFTTLAALDSVVGLIAAWRDGERLSTSSTLLLGISAGLGFWCNQLVAPAIAAAAIGVIVFAPKVLLRFRLWLFGVGAFLISSLPFWLWNMRNDWESFGMSQSMSFDMFTATRNLFLLAFERWPQLWGVHGSEMPRFVVAMVIAASLMPLFAGVVALFAGRDSRGCLERSWTPSRIAQFVLFLYLFFFAVCFCFSYFGAIATPRYLLPLIPVVAVLAGVGAVIPRSLSVRFVAIVATVLILGRQVYEFPAFLKMSSKHNALALRNVEVNDYLKERGFDTAYCAFMWNSLNLSGDGDIAFSDYLIERVPEFRRRLELADSPAIIEDYGGIASWAKASGGAVERAKVAGLRVATAIKPPSRDCVEIPPSELVSIKNSAGAELLPALSDRSIAVPVYMNPDGDCLSVEFKATTRLCGIRIVASDSPVSARIEFLGRKSGKDRLAKIAPDLPEVCAEWSGPRFFPTCGNAVKETFFAPVSLDELNIKFVPGKGMFDGVLYELQLLTTAGEASSGLETVKDWDCAVEKLVVQLRELGINRLYATRWVANSVDTKTDGAIATNYGADSHPKKSGLPRISSRRVDLVLDAHTGVLVSEFDREAMRKICDVRHLRMSEVETDGLGVLFVPEETQEVPFGLDVATGIVLYGSIPLLAPSSTWITEVLAAFPPETLEERIMELYAQNPNQLPLLEKMLDNAAFADIAQEVRERYRLLTCPEFGGEVKFENGFSWLGGRILSQETNSAGETIVLMRHYWGAHSKLDTKAKSQSVFMHLLAPDGSRICFDYPLDENVFKLDYSSSCAGAMRWTHDVRVRISSDVACGAFEMRVGICDNVFGSHRVAMKTSLPHKRNAAIVKSAFTTGNL